MCVCVCVFVCVCVRVRELKLIVSSLLWVWGYEFVLDVGLKPPTSE